MEIVWSARKHGIPDEDILHAVRNAVLAEPMDDDLVLYLGASRAGALLEVVTVVRDDVSELVIHAMPMRARYARLLGEGSDG